MPQVMAAVDFSQQPTAQDQSTFDQILAPVMKIYNLVKYFASALAGIALLIAGVSYMTSGSDPKKRDGAKSMAMYV
ncbi:MAG: pilin, partial [Nanoarchaeota archaeon]|nr:pilin [Nanoarchaeota archaeon]